MKAVAQYLPSLQPADAIGQYVLRLHAALKEAGCPDPRIYAPASGCHPSLRSVCADLREDDPAADRVRIYHGSTGSDVGRAVARARGRRVLVYHNITPPAYFAGWSFEHWMAQRCGLDELAALREDFHWALGVSEYNRADLERAGYRRTGVLPFVPPSVEEWRADPAFLARLRALPGPRLLFVGRLAPHKRIEDLLALVRCLRRARCPEASLVLAGAGLPAYERALRETARALGVDKAVEFAGRVSPEQLAACYRGTHVFVCMSEHEGVCSPLLEAMALGLPVVAYGAAAVPETLGESGVRVDAKRFPEVAELVALLCRDEELRRAVLARQKIRRGAFSQARLVEAVRAWLPRWMQE